MQINVKPQLVILAMLCFYFFSSFVSGRSLNSNDQAEVAPAMQLRLKSELTVELPDIYWSDVFHAPRGGLPAHILSKKFAKSPRAKRSALYTLPEVRAEFSRQFGHLYPSVSIVGDKFLKVLMSGVALDTSAIELAAMDVFNQYLQRLGHEEFSVRTIPTDKTYVIPNAAITYDIDPPTATSIKSRQSVVADVYLNGEHYLSIPLWLDIQIFDEVYVASKDYQSGEIVDLSAQDSLTVDIAAQKQTALLVHSHTRPGADTNMRVLLPLSRGEVFTGSNVQVLPPIYKGQSVAVTLREGPIEIALVGQALEDGGLNSQVKIISSASSRPFYGRVAQSGRVVVE